MADSIKAWGGVEERRWGRGKGDAMLVRAAESDKPTIKPSHHSSPPPHPKVVPQRSILQTLTRTFCNIPTAYELTPFSLIDGTASFSTASSTAL